MHPQDTILALTCESCGITFRRYRANLRGSKHTFCSPRCCGQARAMPTHSAVYAIIHVATERTYIGSTSDLPSRWRSHRMHLRHGTHRSHDLQFAYQTDGARGLVFQVLEAVPDRNDLLTREQAWLDRYRTEGRSLFNAQLYAGSKPPTGEPPAPPVRMAITDVLEVKAKVARGESLSSVAAQYAVTRHAIYCTVTGRAWPTVRASDEIEAALLTRIHPRAKPQQ